MCLRVSLNFLRSFTVQKKEVIILYNENNLRCTISVFTYKRPVNTRNIMNTNLDNSIIFDSNTQGRIQDFNLGRRKNFETYALRYFEERPLALPNAHLRFFTLLGIKIDKDTPKIFP